jgi:hypothetical protein
VGFVEGAVNRCQALELVNLTAASKILAYSVFDEQPTAQARALLEGIQIWLSHFAIGRPRCLSTWPLASAAQYYKKI